jgi:hypothetical protein
MTNFKVVLAMTSGEKKSCPLSEVEIEINRDGVISLTTPFSKTRECLLNSVEIHQIRQEVSNA